MRASFLLVLALALLVGLGVAVAVKTTGLLSPPPVVVQQPPPAPQPVVVVPPPPSILVATRNLYETETVRPGDVRLRPATSDEVKALEAAKADFLPPNAEAAHYRFLAKSIEANTPLRKMDLLEMKRPDGLNTRLAPGFRAVNVQLTKENSAGGLLGVGDWVDVYVTSVISRTDEPGRVPYTGLIARNVQLIAKRDTLFSGFAPIAPTAEIPHTLAANPYRAALIEYARSVGVLTLVPLSDVEKKQFDEAKKIAMTDGTKSLALSVPDTSSPEYKDEEKRVQEYKTGVQSMSSDELARVFNLKPIVVPPPPPSPPPAPKPIVIETFSGTQRGTSSTFQPPAEPHTPPPAPQPKPGKYVFFNPAEKPGHAATPRPANSGTTVTPTAPRN